MAVDNPADRTWERASRPQDAQCRNRAEVRAGRWSVLRGSYSVPASLRSQRVDVFWPKLAGHFRAEPWQKHSRASLRGERVSGAAAEQSESLPKLFQRRQALKLGDGIVLDNGRHQPVSASHPAPVIFISCSTSRTSLIMAAIFVYARPRKSMRATTLQKLLQEIQCVTPSFRLFHWSSQREKKCLLRAPNRSCSDDRRMLGDCDFDTNESTELNLLFGRGP